MDTFAYFHFSKNDKLEHIPTGQWSLKKTSKEDLIELESFYDFESGGLMLKALDLEIDKLDNDSISTEYVKLGFTKNRTIFSLKHGETLKAIAIVSTSDIGLNMSDLTNCIKVVVIDPENTSLEAINHAIALMADEFQQVEIPVLLYPSTFAKKTSIISEKTYTLWALDLHYLDDYFKYCDTLLRRI